MKIISGGQTGADLAGVEWAKQNQLPTGGWMPRSFRNETGMHPEFADLYNMRPTSSPGYPARTERNVHESDGTIIFGNINSPGCTLTRRLCNKYNRPYLIVPYFYNSVANITGTLITPQVRAFTGKVGTHAAATYNVAGNRESTSPGINEFVKAWLTAWKEWIDNAP